MHYLSGLLKTIGGRHKEQLLKNQPLTARDILENPEIFPTDAVFWARITTNIADYLKTKVSGQESLSQSNQEFQITLDPKNQGLSQDLFLLGGSFDFQYSDPNTQMQSAIIDGQMQLGLIKGDTCGTFYAGSNHPFFSISIKQNGMTQFEYNYHYINNAWEFHLGLPWEYTYLKDNWPFKEKPNGYLNMPQAQYQLAIAIASPFSQFLEDLSFPLAEPHNHSINPLELS